MEAIVFIILQMVFAMCAVLKIGEYPEQGRIQGGVDRVDIHPPFFSKKKLEMSLYLK